MSDRDTGSAVRPMTGVAWAVILLLVVAQVLASALGEDAAPDSAVSRRMGNLTLRMQGRMFVGAGELVGRGEVMGQGPGSARDQLEGIAQASPNQRQRIAALMAELDGPAAGLALLDALDALCAEEGVGLSSEDAEVQRLLRLLWTPESPTEADAEEEEEPGEPPGATALTSAERGRLREALGWFGDLALNPARGEDRQAREAVTAPARRTLWSFFAVGGAACLGGLAGLAVIIGLAVVGARGGLQFRLGPSQAPAGVYAETFAVWIALFLGSQYALRAVAGDAPDLLLLGGVMLTSLVALGWPVLRGVPLARVREDVGLTAPAPVTDAAAGLLTYAAVLPLLFFALIAALLLAGLIGAFQGTGAPLDPIPGAGHPIVLALADGDPGAFLRVLFLASVVAPVVEEIAFRGLLHRQLRAATGRWPAALSFCAAALGGSFLFALLHPQGVVGIPPLMMLGTAMCFAREWRGSLVAPMVLHGVSNALVMTVAWGILAA